MRKLFKGWNYLQKYGLFYLNHILKKNTVATVAAEKWFSPEVLPVNFFLYGSPLWMMIQKICKANDNALSERLSPTCTILSSLCFTQISWTEPCRSSKSALLLSGSRLAKYFWLTSCRRMQLRCQLKNWGNAILKLFKVSRFLVIQNLTWNIYTSMISDGS